MTTTPDQLVPIKDLQRLLDEVVAAGAPGILARVQSTTNTSELTSGVADRRSGAPMTSDMHFGVGSNTKSFVATVILQLVGEGRLNLDDPVSKWLSWPPPRLPQAKAITVRQLLNHTSGLFDYLTDPIFLLAALTGKVFAPRELVRFGTSRPLTFPPGTGWAYSNTGYILAGMIIEKITGEDLRQQLQERISKPLDLTHTILPTTREMPKPHPRGYVFIEGLGHLDVTTTFDPSAWWAAGAIVSSAADLGTFFEALLAGKLLAPELLEEMKKTVPTGTPGFDYGLGLMRLTAPGGIAWGHGGRVPGYDSFWTYGRPDGAGSAVTMMNVTYHPEYPPPVAESLAEAGLEAIRQMFDQPGPAVVSTDRLAAFPAVFDDWSGLAEIIGHTAALKLDLPGVTKPDAS